MKPILNIALISLVLLTAGCDKVMEETLIDPGAKAKAHREKLKAAGYLDESSDSDSAEERAPDDAGASGEYGESSDGE